jgi:hypothetical protein
MFGSAMLIYLIALSFLWFVLAIGNGFFLPAMFQAYSQAEVNNFGQQVTIGLLVLFPIICVQTVTTGWSRLLNESDKPIVKITLIPFAVAALIAVLLKTVW